MTLLSRFRGLEGIGTGRYRPALEDLEQSRSWAAQWRDTAEGCGLVHKVVVPAGVTVVVPPIRGLRQDPGHPLTLVIEMLRGQHVTDYTVRRTGSLSPWTPSSWSPSRVGAGCSGSSCTTLTPSPSSTRRRCRGSTAPTGR